jgi:competence protein ComEA
MRNHLFKNRRFIRSTSFTLTCAACGIFATVLALGSASAAQQEKPKKDLLPEGPGKAMVVKKCTQCHDAERFSLLRHTEDEWDQVITQMQSNGLSMTDEEYGAVLNYLSKNLAPTSAPRKDDHN